MVLLGYSSVSIPLAALYFPVYIFLADFYNRSFNISLVEIGIIFVVVRLFDAISDPVMGLISDRFRSRLGLRRLWLIVGAPLVLISVVRLFWPNLDEPIEFLYLFFWFFILTLGWTIMLTPYFALGAEITADYNERSRVTFYREASALIGTVLAAILYSLGTEPSVGMKYIAIFVLIFLPISVLLCIFFVKENVITGFIPEKIDFFKIFIAFRSEPMFLRLLISYFLNGAANGLPAALFVFFVSQRLETANLAGPLLLIYFGAAIISTPFWLRLSKVVPKNKLWCYAMVYASVVFGCTLFVGSGDLLLFSFICLLSGFALSADLAIPSSIQADLVDIETVNGRKRRTGAFFSFWSIATKGAAALSSGFGLLILSYAAFDAQGNNTETALWTLTILYAVVPIILKIFAIFLMWDFPLDARYHDEIQKKIRGISKVTTS